MIEFDPGSFDEYRKRNCEHTTFEENLIYAIGVDEALSFVNSKLEEIGVDITFMRLDKQC